MLELKNNVGLVQSILLYHSGIYNNKDSHFQVLVRYGYYTICFIAIPSRSIYNARTFISR